MHLKLQAAPPYGQDSSYCSGCVLTQNLDHPELIITWGSDFPDKLKIRKEIPLWPFRFKLRADYSRAQRALEYGCSCKVRRHAHICVALLSSIWQGGTTAN